jgi:hypothetical protein
VHFVYGQLQRHSDLPGRERSVDGDLQLPFGKGGSERGLIVSEDGDVDVGVGPRNEAEREIDRPATGDRPGGVEWREDGGNRRDLRWEVEEGQGNALE